MKDTDKVYKIIVSPHFEKYEHEYLIRVPKGVEINQDILKNSWFFKDEWCDEHFYKPSTRLDSISEVNKDLWNDDYPTLEGDGMIHFEGDDYEGVK